MLVPTRNITWHIIFSLQLSCFSSASSVRMMNMTQKRYDWSIDAEKITRLLLRSIFYRDFFRPRKNRMLTPTDGQPIPEKPVNLLDAEMVLFFAAWTGQRRKNHPFTALIKYQPHLTYSPNLPRAWYVWLIYVPTIMPACRYNHQEIYMKDEIESPPPKVNKIRFDTYRNILADSMRYIYHAWVD